MGAKFINNPYDMVIQVFNNLYPECECEVQFDNTMGDGPPWGETFFPEKEGEIPLVNINAELSIQHGVEILAHELAHVKCGVEAGHGVEWESVTNEIHKGFEKLVKNLGGE